MAPRARAARSGGRAAEPPRAAAHDILPKKLGHVEATEAIQFNVVVFIALIGVAFLVLISWHSIRKWLSAAWGQCEDWLWPPPPLPPPAPLPTPASLDPGSSSAPVTAAAAGKGRRGGGGQRRGGGASRAGAKGAAALAAEGAGGAAAAAEAAAAGELELKGLGAGELDWGAEGGGGEGWTTVGRRRGESELEGYDSEPPELEAREEARERLCPCCGYGASQPPPLARACSTAAHPYRLVYHSTLGLLPLCELQQWEAALAAAR